METPLPLGGTLWKVHSAGWTGWLDFLTDGRYLTHWGWGRWAQKGSTLLLSNDYDPFSFVLTVDGRELSGTRSDGSAFHGTFLARYVP